MPPLILGFDTSAAHVCAAVTRGDTCLAAAHEEMARGQAERLVPMLTEILAETGATWHDLAALGVGIGPGNFTGIRISVATARGLALSLGLPAVGVTGFEARAFGIPRPVTALIDAPRDQSYVQRLTEAEVSDPRLIRRDDLAQHLDLHADRWVGDHAGDVAAMLGGVAIAPRYPLAEAIARVASTRTFAEVPRPAPLYVKPADAAPSRLVPPVILNDP